MLGAVERRTHTKGYAVARTGSLNQALAFTSPAEIVLHEVLHMLGCAHGATPNACRDQVRHPREQARENRAAGRDFFPAVTAGGRLITTRPGVERRFARLRPGATCAADAARPC